jgi:hypothetical protein
MGDDEDNEDTGDSISRACAYIHAAPHKSCAVCQNPQPLVRTLQEYLTYKKTQPPRTLPYAQSPRGVLGGRRFPMGEVPL